MTEKIDQLNLPKTNDVNGGFLPCKLVLAGLLFRQTGRLAQLVERRTREHNVSGLYRCGFESPAGQLKLLIVFRMRR